MTAFSAVTNTVFSEVEKSALSRRTIAAFVLTALMVIAVVMVIVGVATMDLTMMIPAGFITVVSALGFNFFYLTK